MRSGPSLRNVDSHALIHEAVLEEARELTELFARCLSRGEQEKAMEIAWIAVEHWESTDFAACAKRGGRAVRRGAGA